MRRSSAAAGVAPVITPTCVVATQGPTSSSSASRAASGAAACAASSTRSIGNGRKLVHEKDCATPLAIIASESCEGYATHDRFTPPVAGINLQLRRRRLGPQHAAERRAEVVERQADVEVEQVLADRLVDHDAPQRGGAAVP